MPKLESLVTRGGDACRPSYMGARAEGILLLCPGSNASLGNSVPTNKTDFLAHGARSGVTASSQMAGISLDS